MGNKYRLNEFAKKARHYQMKATRISESKNLNQGKYGRLLEQANDWNRQRIYRSICRF